MFRPFEFLWQVTVAGSVLWGNQAKPLVEEEDVSPGISDNHGLTLFGCAAHRGHKRVVRVLLKLKDLSGQSAKGTREQ